MKFAIALFAPPHAPSSRRALAFAQVVLAGGHELVRIFVYQDAVFNASNHLVTPQDEADMAARWRAFITDNDLDAVVCIAAALRRGTLDTTEAARYSKGASVQPPWELSGLGQLHEAAQIADRLICFGGP